MTRNRSRPERAGGDEARAAGSGGVPREAERGRRIPRGATINKHMDQENIDETGTPQKADWNSPDEAAQPADTTSNTQSGEVPTDKKYEERRSTFLHSLNSKDNFTSGWDNCDNIDLLFEVVQKSGVSGDALTWALYKAAEEAATKDLYLTQFVKRIEKFHFGKGGPEDKRAIQEMIPVVIATAQHCKEKGKLYGWYTYWVALLAVKNIIQIPEEHIRQLECTASSNDLGDEKTFKEVSAAFKDQLRYIIDDIQQGYLKNSSRA